MGLRTVLIAAALVFSLPPAEAAERSALRRVACTLVRFYVARYGAAAAEAWARSKGASETDIETARRCLKGWPIVNAQN